MTAAKSDKKTKITVPLTGGDAADRKKALETAIAKIEKDYGKGTIMRLGDDIPVNVEALSTGSLTLDLALGIGGVPNAYAFAGGLLAVSAAATVALMKLVRN